MVSVKSLFHFSKSEISHFLKRAKRIVRSITMDLLAHPSKEQYGRLLIMTPKRIGNAVRRNKIRRRLKSIFYEEKLFKQPFDYGIMVKKAALALSFEELKQMFIAHLKKHP